MLSCIAKRQTAISAILAETKKAVDRDMILTGGEVVQTERAIAVLKPLAQVTDMLGGEKMPTSNL